MSDLVLQDVESTPDLFDVPKTPTSVKSSIYSWGASPKRTQSPTVVEEQTITAKNLKETQRSRRSFTIHNSIYDRYIQEDGILKSTHRKDFYCATILFPFFLQAYYPEFGLVRQYLLSLLVYSYFIFVSIAVNIFTILVFFELSQDFKCVKEDSFMVFAGLIASALFVLSLVPEFRLSVEPLLFWWRVVKFGKWEYIIKKEDTSVELISVRAPAFNCISRLLVVGGVQVISNSVLFVVGLLAIQQASTLRDLVKDCLAFIWVSQIDEIIFQYLFLYNSYFKNLWRDEIFEETVYVYRDTSFKKRRSSFFAIVLKNIASSLLGIATVVIVFRLVSQAIIRYNYCQITVTRTTL